jgi:hypothetical protein
MKASPFFQANSTKFSFSSTDEGPNLVAIVQARCLNRPKYCKLPLTENRLTPMRQCPYLHSKLPVAGTNPAVSSSDLTRRALARQCANNKEINPSSIWLLDCEAEMWVLKVYFVQKTRQRLIIFKISNTLHVYLIKIVMIFLSIFLLTTLRLASCQLYPNTSQHLTADSSFQVPTRLNFAAASDPNSGPLRCNVGAPCIDGSCCNSDGFCGFKAEHCRPEAPKFCRYNCTSTAMCGIDSLGGNKKCGLNLCCSYHGWCGVSAITMTESGTWLTLVT